ncbi:MAG TPA: kelch repeat-containing protein [Chitinophagaceae bacterium]
MKLLLKVVLSILFLGWLGFLSCQKDKEVMYNKLPVANAGHDLIIVLPTDQVTLDGTGSSDPDGSINTYLWSKIAGPTTFQIDHPNAARTSVRQLVQGVYQFQLQVTDNRGGSTKDTVQITVKTNNGINHPPVALAGADQTIILPISSTMLDGSLSYDPDGMITAYQWSKVAGPLTYSFQSAQSAKTGVNDLAEGVYWFELVVTDDGKLTAKDTVQVTVKPAGATSCDISGRAHVDAQLTEIGTLSERGSPNVAAAGNKIIFAAGTFSYGQPALGTVSVDIYDVQDGSWKSTSLKPGRRGMAVVSCGNKVFFAGGNNGDMLYDNVDIYDVSTGAWTVAHLSEPRTLLAAAAVGNKVLFAGGISDDLWGQSNTVDIYDIPSDTWTRASLTHAKYGLTAVTAGEKVYFAGGMNYMSSGFGYNDIDIYNSTTNSWSRSTFVELIGGVSGVALGDRIYWGGISPQNAGKAETWSNTHSNLATTCLAYPREYPTALVRNSDIFFFTQGVESWEAVRDRRFDIYHTGTGQWSVGVLPQAMGGVAVISVNNTIYMAGGFNENKIYSNKVYKLSW